MQNFFVAVKNTAFGARICAHKSDDSLIVIKSRHPEVGALIAHAGDIPIVSSIKGSQYFITVLRKEAAIANLGEALLLVATGQIAVVAKEELAPEYTSLGGTVSDLDADEGEEGLALPGDSDY